MLIHAARPLFAWSEMEDSPSLRTIRAVLSSLPDRALLDGLQQARGHGRDDYPVRVLWGVVVLSVLCRHVWLNDCLAELHRNPTLCAALGIQRVVDIPKPHNLSRFLDVICAACVTSSTSWSRAWARPCPSWAKAQPVTALPWPPSPRRTPLPSPRKSKRGCPNQQGDARSTTTTRARWSRCTSGSATS